MNKYTLLLVCILFAFALNAQNSKKIKITREKVGEGLFDFYAENPNYYPMQLELYFTEFENMKASCKLPYVATISRGKQLIFNVRRTIIEIPGSFQYKYKTRIGAFPVIPDEKYTYNLPVGKGKSTKSIGFNYKNSSTPEKTIWGFGMGAGDTIKACRDGVVCMQTETRLKDSLRTGINSLVLLHSDNTFGKYELFNDNQIFVEIGDSVIKGENLGIVESGVYSVIPHVRFSVYHTNVRIDSINANKLRNTYSFINPLFLNKKGKGINIESDKIYD